MSCQFVNVGGSSQNCQENYSGIGTSIYIFSSDNLATVDASPEYEDDLPEYTQASFHGVKLHRIVIKSQSGKVTHSNNPNAGGFNNIFTGLVANDMENMSLMGRTMNNLNNWGLLVPDGSGKMYVIYAKDFDLKFEMSGDTGDTPDSDHGHTLTVTAGPCRYPFVKWNGHVEEENGHFYAYLNPGGIRPWVPVDLYSNSPSGSSSSVSSSPSEEPPQQGQL